MSNTLNWSTTAPHSASAPGNRALDETGAAHSHDALAPGTRLDEFEIVRVLGAGGFGIVYLALDTVLQRQVAIKEYMPTALAGRRSGAMVSVRSPTQADTFALGLESFFSEARMLASFDHPSLVKVHRFWKANGTAYMVMPYYPGQTLKQARLGMREAPDGRWLLALVEPLLGALEVLHRDGVYHRDISPDNILLLPDGRPVLLDFGSARRVVGDNTQSLTALVKPNFAPVEQYADQADMRQGPWTDLYALGATVHYMLTGLAPSPAVLRAVRDGLPALSALSGEGDTPYPDVPMRFLATIDWTLALAPDDRPQSVAFVRQGFNGDVVPPQPSARHSPPKEPKAPSPAHAAAPRDAAKTAPMQPSDNTARDADAAHLSTVPKVDTVGLLQPGPPPAAAPVARRAGWVVLTVVGASALAWAASTTRPPPTTAEPIPAVATSAGSVTAPALLLTAVAPPAVVAPVAAVAPVAVTTAAASAANVQPLPTVAKPIPAPAALHMAPALPVRAVTLAASGVPAVRAAAMNPAPTEARSTRVAKVIPADAAPTGPDATRSPSEFCGGQSFLVRAVCVNRECQTPRWRAHSECVAARQDEEQRQRRLDRY